MQTNRIERENDVILERKPATTVSGEHVAFRLNVVAVLTVTCWQRPVEPAPLRAVTTLWKRMLRRSRPVLVGWIPFWQLTS